MALIKCPECGREVSSEAASCPNCGRPIKGAEVEEKQTRIEKSESSPKPKKSKGCLVMIIILGLFMGGLAVGVNEMAENPDQYTQKTEELDKESAAELDEEVWDIVLYSIVLNNHLMEGIESFANQQISAVTLYDESKKVSDILQKQYTSYPTSKNEDAMKYIDSCKTFTLSVQVMADSLKKYVNSEKTEDLSKVKENIETASQALSIVAANRGVFLTTMGYSEEEVQAVVNRLDEEIEQKKTEIIK